MSEPVGNLMSQQISLSIIYHHHNNKIHQQNTQHRERIAERAQKNFKLNLLSQYRRSIHRGIAIGIMVG
jgi:hypothetical protein